MVYVYGRKRKGGAPMARSRKKTRLTVSPRLVGGAAARMNKTTLYGTWFMSTASTAGFWRYLEFTAGSLPEWSDLALVFDEYRVNKLTYTFRPSYSSYPVVDNGALSSVGMPYLHLIVDPASTKIPNGAYNSATELDMLDQGMAKSYSADKAISISFKPKVLGGLLNGGTAAQAMSAPWIRTSEEATTHTGLHAFIKQHAFNATPSISFDVYITADIEFRGNR